MEAITNSSKKSLETILKEKLASAKEIIFCVSFIKNSGVELLFNYLKYALKNKAKISILTSTYLNVTEPVALYKLKSLKEDNLSLAIFDHDKLKTSFHIKGYYFKFIEENEQMIIGSSNLSKSALTTGLEWNIIIDEKEVINDFLSQYDDIYENYSFNPSDEWLYKYLIEYKPLKNSDFQYSVEPSSSDNPVEELAEDNTLPEQLTKSTYKPIKCQVPALYELDRARQEGIDKALVIMATGLGKTFLSAFDSKNFRRVLFIAHREEILDQAYATFKKIRPSASFGYFKANRKDTDKDIIFGSISTLGKSIYHNNDIFPPDYFDYIIVDEFHHSAAPSYLNFLDYFKPKFLLGLTATPDRLDNKDIYQYCDYNIPFECNFITAINNGWLVPFSYYAIYDDVDYENIPWRSGKYDLNALENAFLVKKRSDNIIKNYREKAGKHTLAFCCSIRHANYTAEQFRKENIKAYALHSNSPNRSQLISKFSKGDIDILCVVDIFNEGIDIPQIDTVMFLRPTESFTIFIQQLGRGLRTNPNKKHLTVIDLVGNYKNSHYKLAYLSGFTPRDLNEDKDKASFTLEQTLEKLPVGCSLDIDTQLIDIFAILRAKKINIKEKLISNYKELQESLNNPYSLSEFNSASDFPGKIYRKKFGSWLNFLHSIFPDNQIFSDLIESNLAKLLLEIEETSMTKLYKMPTILALIQKNKLQTQTSLDNIVASFKLFYNSSINSRDLMDYSNRDYEKWTDKDWASLAERNPIYYLSKNQKSLFNYDWENKSFYLELNKEDLELIEKYNKEITFFVKDIIQFRREDYVKMKRYK
jgi:superfamily II DNA or RNA helicase/HKD family nuclease